MELCEKLKQIRKENNLTQQQLADELCLSRTVITKYERGHKVPNLDTLILISNYFNTGLFDEYKNKLKLFILSIRCCIPYLISLALLVISSLSLASNIINVNSQYGYNIYNDELKVKNCDEIILVRTSFNVETNENNLKTNTISLVDLTKSIDEKINKKYFVVNNVMDFNDTYYLLFLNNSYNNDETYRIKEITISHKPFIYPLKDYNESLPYNEQTGECSKILNYYIDLIEKVK